MGPGGWDSPIASGKVRLADFFDPVVLRYAEASSGE
jgi:hypothetical protein